MRDNDDRCAFRDKRRLNVTVQYDYREKGYGGTCDIFSAGARARPGLLGFAG